MAEEQDKIDTFIADVADTKQAVINLLEPLKKINDALRVIADNQNHLNGKLNSFMLEFRNSQKPETPTPTQLVRESSSSQLIVTKEVSQEVCQDVSSS